MLARLMRRRSSSPLPGLLHQGGAAASVAPASLQDSSLLSHHHQHQQQHTAAAALPGLKICDSASQVHIYVVTIYPQSSLDSVNYVSSTCLVVN